LRAGHFVHEMPVNIKEARAILGLVRHMGIPNFVVKCFSHLILGAVSCASLEAE